jgi:hypothetical protein
VTALDAVFAGRRAWDEALRNYQRTRDGATEAMFEMTCQLASSEPPDEETAGLFGMIASSSAASNDFASVLAGTMTVQAFFDDMNLERYQAPAEAAPRQSSAPRRPRKSGSSDAPAPRWPT